jgi:hypothetical protein
VVTAPGVPIERAMNSLKSYATRELIGAGLVERGQNVWARHGSTRYLVSEQDVIDACTYVLYGQD